MSHDLDQGYPCSLAFTGRLGTVNWLVCLALYNGQRWGKCLNNGAHFQYGRAAVAAFLLLGEAGLNRLAPL